MAESLFPSNEKGGEKPRRKPSHKKGDFQSATAFMSMDESDIDKVRRNAYLRSKGISPADPLQLDLLFPDTLNDGQRVIPNDYARSSLFTTRNKREPRRTLQHEKLFHLHDGVSILFTGIELRAEDDEVVWLQILHYAKSVPLGEPFDFTIKQLVADVGWSKNGRYYDKARECISRLKANEVMVFNEKAFGKSGAISLIDKYTMLNDAEGKPLNYRVWIDPNLIVLFAGNTFTNHAWLTYRNLSPVARRLADYIESHQYPFPLEVEKFKGMCGSLSQELKGWRRTVRQACTEVEQQRIAKRAVLNEDDKIYIVR
ncbi:plasmid replication initiator TrfA [Chromobacterium violaceum]|uniref:plasmid replication initiator TrfA n=1 Tax=Chromobacterium violaceum TaxID=536 RepID=UPI0035A6337F